MSPCPYGCGNWIGPLQDCPNPPCLTAANDEDAPYKNVED